MHNDLTSHIEEKACLDETTRNIRLFEHIKELKDNETLDYSPAGVEKICKKLGIELSQFSSDLALLISSETIFIDASLADYKTIFSHFGQTCVAILSGNSWIAFMGKLNFGPIW